MKKYIYSLFAAVLFLFFSRLFGRMTTARKTLIRALWASGARRSGATRHMRDFDVYVEFLSDGTFNIFQKVETPTFVCYSGDFAVNGAQLSGRYRDGEPWGASYAFELSGDGKTLTMISQTDKAEEASIRELPFPKRCGTLPKCAPRFPVRCCGFSNTTTLKSKSSLDHMVRLLLR